jgi:hypothetical protein
VEIATVAVLGTGSCFSTTDDSRDGETVIFAAADNEIGPGNGCADETVADGNPTTLESAGAGAERPSATTFCGRDSSLTFAATAELTSLVFEETTSGATTSAAVEFELEASV